MDTQALQAMLQAGPESYDLGMLSPLKKHLSQATSNATMAGDPEAATLIDQLHAAVSALEDEQTKRLDEYATGAMEDFEKAVKAKRDTELRWIDDDRLYNGLDTLPDSKAYPSDAGDRLEDSEGDRPALRAARSRTLRYYARLVDMLIPGNDIPMEVKPPSKPDPQCFPKLALLMEHNQPLDPAGVLDMAQDAASGMQETIKDQLLEQDFQGTAAHKIFDACHIGVGLSKGPIMDYRKRRKPVGGKSQIVLDESPIPGYQYVNPWMFYYDMSPTLDECSQCWEVHLMDRRAVNDLKRYPNMIEKNITLLLEDKDPQMPKELAVNIGIRNSKRDSVETIKDRWAVIEMHGLIDPDELEKATGTKWEDTKSLPLIEFWFCNGKALKWKLSAMECDWRVPYYNFTPFPCDDTIFGYGVPRMGRGGAKLIKGALDATMLNASCAAGPFIAFKKGEVVPSDGGWRVVGPKMLEVTSDGPINDALTSFVINSNVDGNLALIQKGLDFLDDDILLDQITQGDISSEEMPASGLIQVINLKTVFQRMIAKSADNTWFKKQGERWVQWNLQFNPDLSIKGDFDVKGIASTALVSKDLQIQHLQVGMQVSAQPQFAGMVDHYQELDAFYRMLDVPNRGNIMFDKATADKNAAAAAQQGGDPMVQVKMQELQQTAQQAQADLQLKQQQMQADQQQQQAELQLKQQEVAFAHAERMAEIQRQTQNDQTSAQVQILVAQSKKDVAIMQLAQEQKLQIWQVAAAMKKAGLDADTKTVLAMMKGKETAVKEQGQNIRTAAQLGVQTAHKAADIHKENTHKAVDVAMQREAQGHAQDLQSGQQQHETVLAQNMAQEVKDQKVQMSNKKQPTGDET